MRFVPPEDSAGRAPVACCVTPGGPAQASTVKARTSTAIRVCANMALPTVRCLQKCTLALSRAAEYDGASKLWQGGEHEDVDAERWCLARGASCACRRVRPAAAD